MQGDGDGRNAPEARSVAAIEAGLDRILASETFRGAPQLSAFLSFIVGRAVAGRSAEIKGYTIAVEAFGRPPEFDPQADPIVRVEAGRLRKALSHYYAGEGARDPVRIGIPVGGYAPVFEIQDEAAPLAPQPPEAPAPGSTTVAAPVTSGSSRWRLAALLALSLAVFAFFGWYREAAIESPPAGAPAAASVDPPVAAMSHLPVVALTLADVTGDAELMERVRYFMRALADAMARFDDLVTVRTGIVVGKPVEGADYVFEIVAMPVGDQTEGFGRLRSLLDGRIVWSASRMQPRGSGNDQELGDLARRLAVRLAEPFGIIHADFRQVATSPAMRCVFQALDFRRTMKPEDHLAARNCLEAALDKDKTFHAAWAQLALLNLDEHVSGFNPRQGPPLDRALAAALNALRYAPSSARAQQIMMDVLFARGQIEDALNAGRQALSYNPYDPDIMADLGARLVQLNRPTEGLPLLQKAIELSGGRPLWYDFFAYLGARLTGADRLAEGYAGVFVADDSFLGLLGRAMHQAGSGDRATLAATIAALVRTAPDFARDPRRGLAMRGFQPVVIDRVLSALGPETLELIRPQ